MYSKYKAQDVVRCDSYQTDVPHMNCDICHINLCIACVMEHLSDESKDHKLVSFNKKTSNITYPRCQKHAAKIYELHCKRCTFFQSMHHVFPRGIMTNTKKSTS